eukprot:201937_1
MSRYYDYDYDRNCIIGFGPDDMKHDDCTHNDDISPTSSQSGDSIPNISSPSPSAYSFKDEETSDADDDVLYILPADPKSIQSLNLKPMNVDVPFLLVSDLIKQCTFQPITPSFSDSINPKTTDKNIQLNHHSMNVPFESIQRVDDFNGSYYNAFGTTILRPNTCHIWRFQLLGNAPSIIGIIESKDHEDADALHGAYFGCMSSRNAYSFNTITARCYSSVSKQQPVYQQMLQNGVLDNPMIIDVELDLYRGIMTITNKTEGSAHDGKQILLFSNIDTNKSYTLALALLGPETINLF